MSRKIAFTLSVAAVLTVLTLSWIALPNRMNGGDPGPEAPVFAHHFDNQIEGDKGPGGFGACACSVIEIETATAQHGLDETLNRLEMAHVWTSRIISLGYGGDPFPA